MSSLKISYDITIKNTIYSIDNLSKHRQSFELVFQCKFSFNIIDKSLFLRWNRMPSTERLTVFSLLQLLWFAFNLSRSASSLFSTDFGLFKLFSTSTDTTKLWVDTHHVAFFSFVGYNGFKLRKCLVEVNGFPVDWNVFFWDVIFLYIICFSR